ncbi:MAG: serine/threonine-protein kinase [Nannocystaceae bacterium]
MNGESESRSAAPCPHCGGTHALEALVCPNTDAVMPLSGRLLAGKFRLLHELGAGGMGVVWRAHHELVHKDVAIKIMRREYVRDAKVMERFRREATAAGRIGNTHICDILDFGESEIGPFMVMEMLEGESLESLFERVNTLDPGLIVIIVRQALLGLEAAHRAGIIHRDLKPENIFLHEPRPGHLLVKLMDFGISKFSEDIGGGKTGHGVLMGTPEYMSPEQFEGAAKVDSLTDIWAMGVLLYRGLTGTMPFRGNTLAELLMQVTSHSPPSPVELVPTLDPALSDIVIRCLARAGTDRPSSAEVLHSLLGPYETMSPTTAAQSMSEMPARPRKAAVTPPGAETVEARPDLDDSWSGGPGLAAALREDSWTMGGGDSATKRGMRRGGRSKSRRGVLVGFLMLLCSVVGGMMFVGTGDARDPLQWVAGLLEGMTTAGGSTGGTTGGPEGTAASESSGATGAAAITGDAESSASAHGTTGGAETTTVAGGDAKGQDGGVESASTGGDTGEATEATGSGDGGESTTGPAPEADTAGSTTEVTPPTPKPSTPRRTPTPRPLSW